MERKPGELCYDYRARRLMEQEETKEKLKPRLIWVSSELVVKDGKLYKQQVNGTFRRAIHQAEGSLYDKRRQVKILKKLKKKGLYDGPISEA